MNEWTFASATQIAAAIKSKKISSIDILDHYLARVTKHNSALNAIVVTNADSAREAANNADREIASGVPTGPLHGVPMTIKEAFDIAGQPSTWGLEEHRDNIAATDSITVQRYRDAGAIIFGKTNVPASLSDWQSFNPIYGTTNNPWDHNKVPGGSSGGSAAALAAGLSALETGSDIGASIRNPAHYCGVYGHKPTMAIASSQGHSLPDWRATPEVDIAVVGPLARSAYDLQIALDVMACPHPEDSIGWQLNLPACDKNSLKEFTVGIVYDDEEAEVDEGVQEQLRTLAAFLKSAGVTVKEQHRPSIESRAAHETYLSLLRAATSTGATNEAYAELQKRATNTDSNATDYESRMILGTTLTHRDWLFIDNTRHCMRQQWHEYFNDTDLLLCPAATTVAFDHNQNGERWERMIDVNGNPQPTTTALFWAGYSGVVYLPSTVAPVGLHQGLPVGVQIIGPQCIFRPKMNSDSGRT